MENISIKLDENEDADWMVRFPPESLQEIGWEWDMLSVKNLRVKYGPIVALKGISLEVKKGSIMQGMKENPNIFSKNINRKFW